MRFKRRAKSPVRVPAPTSGHARTLLGHAGTLSTPKRIHDVQVPQPRFRAVSTVKVYRSGKLVTGRYHVEVEHKPRLTERGENWDKELRANAILADAAPPKSPRKRTRKPVDQDRAELIRRFWNND